MKQIKNTIKTTGEIVKYTLRLLPITITLGFPSRTETATHPNQSYVYVDTSIPTYSQETPKLEELIQPTISRPATYSQAIQDSTYYKRLAVRIAREEGLDPVLAHAIINAESSWDPKAKSPKGARGLMQLMPGTAKELGLSRAEIDFPEPNMRAGMRYLKTLLDRYNGNVPKALAAYNAGPTKVDKSRDIPTYTKKYVNRVMGYMSRSGPKG